MDDDEDKEKDGSMEDSDADDGELIDVPPIEYSDGNSANKDDEEISRSGDSAGDSDDMEEDDFKTDEDKEDLIEVEEEADEEGPLDWDD